MARQRIRKRPMAEINVVPYIDVMLVMLVIFMITAPLLTQGVKVDLPEASGSPALENVKVLDLLVSADGSYSVNGQALINKKIDTLKAAILEVSGADNTQPMTITADASATHQAVVTAMDAAGQLGFVHLSITTRKPATDAAEE